LTVFYAALALVAFAANSVLCRLALQQAVIDPASFSTIRFTSGALTLLSLAVATRRKAVRLRGSWMTVGVLCLYAVPFAFAYNRLTTGTGALILFGTVQVTMWAAALKAGDRPGVSEWIGVTLALVGLIYLVLPGLSAPPLSGAALMTTAGLAWGVYSLHGRGAPDPLSQTMNNFLRTVPILLLVNLVERSNYHVERRGALLAVASGALASGLGYVAWYAALRSLTAVRAAVVQLGVPVLAAAGGVILLGEAISVRLIVSAMMIVGGIAMTISAEAT
jgi:drug/metabolite transporter (DMT)-like permease